MAAETLTSTSVFQKQGRSGSDIPPVLYGDFLEIRSTLTVTSQAPRLSPDCQADRKCTHLSLVVIWMADTEGLFIAERKGE